MDKYKVIDHPSDIGIEVYGKTLSELFENAAFGMMDMMFDLTQVDTKRSFAVKISAENIESLLISWLSELIYISDAKKIALCKFEINKLTDTQLEAKVIGGKINKVKESIKAATYSQLEIKEDKGFFKARIVFDV